jgi:hypothetical protein
MKWQKQKKEIPREKRLEGKFMLFDNFTKEN